MKHLHKKKIFEYALALLFIFLIIYLGQRIGFSNLIDFIKSHLLLSLIIYFLYCIISNVFIFLPLVPLWPIMVYLYGFPIIILLTILGTLIAAAISFLLARTFGKKFVIGIMGKHLFNELEHITQFKSTKKFLVIRLLGNNYHDLISYLAGLSKLSFQNYILVTSFTTAIWTLILFYLIQVSGGINNITSLLTLFTAYSVIVLLLTSLWEIYHKK